MSTNAPGIVQARPSRFNMIDPKAIKRREGWNPRFDFGEIDMLAKSIKVNGVLNPIRVKRLGEGFELIDGDRRLTAIEHLMKAGHKFDEGIPAIVEKENSEDLENLIKMFEANSGKPFLPLEEAEAYRRMHAPVKEGGFGMTLKQIAEKVGRNHVHIVDTIRLLSADEAVQEAVRNQKLGATAAKHIAKAKKEDQKELVDKAVATPRGKRTQLKREVEAKRSNKRKTSAPKEYAMTVVELQEQEKSLVEMLKTKAGADGWDNSMEAIAKGIKDDDTLCVAATYGLLLGVRLALGKKVKIDL